MDKPKISVIMSVYNNEKHIKEAVDSILNQTYENFEFIIVDDNSTDLTKDIIYSYNDSRIIFIENMKNKGLTKNLNYMINISKGEYIARMDGDDISDYNRFKKQIEILDNNKDVDLVFTKTVLIDDQGNKLCKSWSPKSIDHIMKSLDYHNYIPHPTVMIRKKSIYKYGYYNEEYKTGQDKELWIRMRDNGAIFSIIPEILLKYRINPNSVRSSNRKSYKFKIASVCISNNNKREAINHISNLNIREKIIIFIRLIIPFRIWKFIEKTILRGNKNA